MRFALSNIVLVAALVLSACTVEPNQVSANGIPSPTPFQPLTENASDSPYSAAAPTPLHLPTLTPLPPTLTPVVIQPELIPPGITLPQFVLPTELNPLTGLPPDDPSLLERHPVAVKIANYPRYIRPQSGLTLADHVYEYYIEDGLTRFVGVFYSNNSEWVGPVRSGRYFDENIQRMYHAYLVFKFADKRVQSYFNTTDFAEYLVTPTIGSCPPFRKMEMRRNIEDYNNEYFNLSAWGDCVARDGLDNKRPSIRNGFFSEIPPNPDLLGLQVFTYYSVDSYNYWVYRPDINQYIRYQERDDMRDGKGETFDLLMDNVTATPVHASNVVFILAYHTFANSFDADDEVYHIDLTGSGEAYVFRDGVGIVAQWYRTNRDQPLLLTTPAGTPIDMRPGITFFEVIGENSYVDQGDGIWNFHHETP